MSNHDPDPTRTPGLEPGGGVPPGETPPASGSENSAVSPIEGPDPPRAVPWIWIAVMIVGALLVAAFFVARAVSFDG